MATKPLVIGALLALLAILLIRWFRRRRGPAQVAVSPRVDRRGDAYFRAMFPELQPWFHPENVVRFVRDRNSRGAVGDGQRWRGPAGFSNAAAATVGIAQGRERIRILDASGAAITAFDYELQASGGVLRLGRGKLTAVLDDDADPRVRYWHPEREFKWTRRGGWQFRTPVAEQPFEADADDPSHIICFPSSSSSGAESRPVFESGKGGDFAGGGASAAWHDTAFDEARGTGESAGATAY